MNRAKIYIESSVISVQGSRTTTDIVRLAKQRLTNDWWKTLDRYETYISDAVWEEIEQGDPVAARRRTLLVAGFSSLLRTPPVEELADLLVIEKAVPGNVRMDAVHIALASVYGMKFLVTWNQKHIANRQQQRQVEAVIVRSGYVPAILITPEQLLLVEDET